MNLTLTERGQELNERGKMYLNTAGLILPGGVRGLLKELLEIIEAMAQAIDSKAAKADKYDNGDIYAEASGLPFKGVVKK